MKTTTFDAGVVAHRHAAKARPNLTLLERRRRSLRRMSPRNALRGSRCEAPLRRRIYTLVPL